MQHPHDAKTDELGSACYPWVRLVIMKSETGSLINQEGVVTMLTTTIEERLGQPRVEAIELAVLSVEIDSAGGYSAYMQSLTARVDNMIVHSKSMIEEVDALIASTAAIIDRLD